jgi:hypothetical protein
MRNQSKFHANLGYLYFSETCSALEKSDAVFCKKNRHLLSAMSASLGASARLGGLTGQGAPSYLTAPPAAA